MSELANIINSLEVKFARLVQRLNAAEEENEILKARLEKALNEAQYNEQALNTLYEKYEAIQLANSLLGSEETKRETKLKINSLIKEIDLCIAHLSK